MSIKVEKITKQFGSFKAVDDVSFQLKTGELAALLGPSGSGKSTILRIIAGLETPDIGSVHLKEEEATSLSAKDRNIGFVFQHYALFKHMTIFENIAFGLKVRKVAKAEAEARTHELIKLVQLEGLENRYPNQLSGGQRQRVALARALAPRPKVLLLDEPFGALDAKVREELRVWIRHLHEESGLTTLFVTHDQNEALDIAHKILVINNGRVEQEGTPEQIFDKPATDFVAQFVGDTNHIDAIISEPELVVWGPFRFTVNKKFDRGQKVRIYFRPSDVYVTSGQETLQVSAAIKRIHFRGATIELVLEIEAGKTIVAHLPKGVAQASNYYVGQKVFVGLTSYHVFGK